MSINLFLLLLSFLVFFTKCHSIVPISIFHSVFIVVTLGRREVGNDVPSERGWKCSCPSPCFLLTIVVNYTILSYSCEYNKLFFICKRFSFDINEVLFFPLLGIQHQKRSEMGRKQLKTMCHPARTTTTTIKL